jgi:hypothetical protein
VRTLRADLEWAPTAPAVARHTVAAWLAGADCDEAVADAAVLVVSELVSRVVADAAGAPVLRADVTEDAVRIEVTAATMFDRPAPSRALGEVIVARLCDEWGFHGSGTSTRAWAAISGGAGADPWPPG